MFVYFDDDAEQALMEAARRLIAGLPDEESIRIELGTTLYDHELAAGLAVCIEKLTADSDTPLTWRMLDETMVGTEGGSFWGIVRKADAPGKLLDVVTDRTCVLHNASYSMTSFGCLWRFPLAPAAG